MTRKKSTPASSTSTSSTAATSTAATSTPATTTPLTCGEQLSTGEKITLVRETLGLSITAFANRCGYAASSILRIERGEADLTDEMCEKICSVYGVNPAWLKDSGKPKRGRPRSKPVEMFTDKRKYGTRFLPGDLADAVAQGERVRAVYQESGLSQRTFCEKIGSSTSNLQGIMNGKRSLTVRYAEKIEKACGVGVDWLLFGVEEAKQYPCDDEMIRFLKGNVEIRREIWKLMGRVVHPDEVEK